MKVSLNGPMYNASTGATQLGSKMIGKKYLTGMFLQSFSVCPAPSASKKVVPVFNVITNHVLLVFM